MAARGEAQADVEVSTLVVPAWRLRWRAPELALVLGERAVALASTRRDELDRLRAEALVIFASNRMGRDVRIADRALDALKAAEAVSERETAWRLRVELADSARSVGAPLTGFAAVRPVLEADDVPPGLRATALVQASECLVSVGRGTALAQALDEADRLYQADPVLDHDTALLQRGLLRASAAGQHRRWGDLRAAVDAARDGLALLDRLKEADADNGQVRGKLTVELVCALLDLNKPGEASEVGTPLLERPVRAPSASTTGWLRLALATRVHLPAGRVDQARDMLRDAADSAQRHQLDILVAESLLALAHVHEVAGDLVEALANLRSAHAAERRRARAVYAVRARLAAEFAGVHRKQAGGLHDELAALLRTGTPAATPPTDPNLAPEVKQQLRQWRPVQMHRTEGVRVKRSRRAAEDMTVEGISAARAHAADRWRLVQPFGEEGDQPQSGRRRAPEPEAQTQGRPEHARSGEARPTFPPEPAHRSTTDAPATPGGGQPPNTGTQATPGHTGPADGPTHPDAMPAGSTPGTLTTQAPAAVVAGDGPATPVTPSAPPVVAGEPVSSAAAVASGQAGPAAPAGTPAFAGEPVGSAASAGTPAFAGGPVGSAAAGSAAAAGGQVGAAVTAGSPAVASGQVGAAVTAGSPAVASGQVGPAAPAGTPAFAGGPVGSAAVGPVAPAGSAAVAGGQVGPAGPVGPPMAAGGPAGPAVPGGSPVVVGGPVGPGAAGSGAIHGGPATSAAPAGPPVIGGPVGSAAVGSAAVAGRPAGPAVPADAPQGLVAQGGSPARVQAAGGDVAQAQSSPPAGVSEVDRGNEAGPQDVPAASDSADRAGIGAGGGERSVPAAGLISAAGAVRSGRRRAAREASEEEGEQGDSGVLGALKAAGLLDPQRAGGRRRARESEDEAVPQGDAESVQWRVEAPSRLRADGPPAGDVDTAVDVDMFDSPTMIQPVVRDDDVPPVGLGAAFVKGPVIPTARVPEPPDFPPPPVADFPPPFAEFTASAPPADVEALADQSTPEPDQVPTVPEPDQLPPVPTPDPVPSEPAPVPVPPAAPATDEEPPKEPFVTAVVVGGKTIDLPPLTPERPPPSPDSPSATRASRRHKSDLSLAELLAEALVAYEDARREDEAAGRVDEDTVPISPVGNPPPETDAETTAPILRVDPGPGFDTWTLPEA